MKADDSTGVGATLQFKFIPAGAAAPALSTGGSAAAAVITGAAAAAAPISTQAMTSFVGGSGLPAAAAPAPAAAPASDSVASSGAAASAALPDPTAPDEPLSKCFMEYSAKFVLVDQMLKKLKAETSERIIA